MKYLMSIYVEIRTEDLDDAERLGETITEQIADELHMNDICTEYGAVEYELQEMDE